MTLRRQLNKILKSILRLQRKKKSLLSQIHFENVPTKHHIVDGAIRSLWGECWYGLCSSFVSKERTKLLWECCEECLKRLPLQQKAAGDLFTAILAAASRGNKTTLTFQR